MIEVVVLISLVGTAAIALLNENKTVVNEQYSFYNVLIYKENAYEVLNSNIHYFNPEKFEIEKLKWQESKTDGFIDFGSVLLELDTELSRKEFFESQMWHVLR